MITIMVISLVVVHYKEIVRLVLTGISKNITPLMSATKKRLHSCTAAVIKNTIAKPYLAASPLAPIGKPGIVCTLLRLPLFATA